MGLVLGRSDDTPLPTPPARRPQSKRKSSLKMSRANERTKLVTIKLQPPTETGLVAEDDLAAVLRWLGDTMAVSHIATLSNWQQKKDPNMLLFPSDSPQEATLLCFLK